VIIVKNLFLKFDFSFDKLILGQNIVVDKLLDLNVAVVVLVTFAEKLVDNLASVIFIDTFLF
jgi:predicted transposase YdaD